MRRTTTLFALASCAWIAIGTFAAAQVPAGPRLSKTSGESVEAGKLRLFLGESALAAGKTAAAVQHFLATSELAPDAQDVWLNLLRASQDDADSRFLFGYRWALAAADARGKFKLDRSESSLLPNEAQIKTLVTARKSAINSLVKFITKLRAHRKSAKNGVVARWATNLLVDLCRPMPAQRALHAAVIDKSLDRHRPDVILVMNALKSVMQNPPAIGTSSESSPESAQRRAQDLAMRAARLLRGLSIQANLKDLEGPKPPAGVSKFGDVARDGLAKLRDQIAARIGAPFTIAQLEAMTPDQRVAFSAEHNTWANPGIALSPTGKYRVETTCGFETLLGATQTVEMHHQRLSNWAGKDPFERQGIVRIVPEFGGLESDGTNYWWAGGFQAGDVTTIRFAWSSISSLGRTLTHELTHRFDGALYAFLPSWLTEGRAVWTASAYGPAEHDQFQPRVLNPFTAQDGFVKRYGSVDKLETLLTGDVDDYRDNYTAGYALFVFLATWEANGQAIYKERLDRFMRNARGGRKQPVDFFATHFADGKDGRPADLAGFAKQFQVFLKGCYDECWGEGDQPWMQRYIRRPKGKIKRRGLVQDEPSWSWERARAEPWFGQRHAALAGHLLAEVGKDDAAIAAFAWALETDGWHRPDVERLAEVAERSRQKDIAWIARHRLGDRDTKAPMLRTLPKVQALLTVHDEVGKSLRTSGLQDAARALAIQSGDIWQHIGGKPAPSTPGAAARTDLLYPSQEPPRALNLQGWAEGGPTDFEERRRDGLYYETTDGDLHVGRAKPRDDTGLLDRRAHQNHVFVRSPEWHPPGSYVLRAKAHFTTSFVNGAIILGHTRRDRNIRLTFRAGSLLYALGKTEEESTTDSVSFSMTGKWERGPHLPQSTPSYTHKFEEPSSSFDVEIWVDGPSARVVIDGKPRMSFATPDGSPIEGNLGFAMSQGSVRIQQPRVQRLDRDDFRDLDGRTIGLDPSSPADLDLSQVLRHPTAGIPTAELGSIVLWIPDSEHAAKIAARSLRGYADEMADAFGFPQDWVLALPASIEEKARSELTKTLGDAATGRTHHVVHAHTKGPFLKGIWVLFVDAEGVLRAAERFLSPIGSLPRGVRLWTQRYRPRSR